VRASLLSLLFAPAHATERAPTTRTVHASAATMALLAVDRRQFEATDIGVLTARIPGVLHAELRADGLLARASGDELGLTTVSYGSHPLGGAEPTLGGCAPTSEWMGPRCAPAAELDHGLLTEWWTSSALGVHQGWTLHTPPEADTARATLHLRPTRGHLHEVDADGQGAWFTGHRGGLWRYEDLAAWDATGRRLDVHLVDEGAELTVVVDVAGATWPVTVDPSLSPALTDETKLVASDGAAYDYFGQSVSGAGDVNGDGYPDIVVGAYGDAEAGTYTGAAYLYYGSATGISSASEDKVVASDGASYDYFGSPVSGAGDVDGDGYDDLVVAAYGDDDNGWASGAAYVYYGSASGISSASEYKLMATDGAANDRFGWSVSGAGDLDADGYDDLVVGAHADDDNGSSSGSVYVYYGSATGITTVSEHKLSASDGAADALFGDRVSGAGDVDGDGYDDLVVGAPGDDGNGAVYVYYGSATGVMTASEDKVVASDGASEDYFGSPVSGAGDLDGDGYDDLVVGAYKDDDNGTLSGSAYLYYGSATGILSASEHKLVSSDGATYDYYGWSVSGAGDLDGDGYDDLVVGAIRDNDAGTYSGSAYVYFGNPTGVSSTSERKLVASDAAGSDSFGVSVAGAGDLDSDGYDDLVVGAHGNSDDGTYSGSAYVRDGGCRDLDGDGYECDDDCDDSDANTYPGAAELESATAGMTDADGDGYGDDSPATGVTAGTDCDDTDLAVSPDGTEGVGDEVDQDCDGVETCYADADDDGFIDGTTTVASADVDCTDPGEGQASDGMGECDDTDATTFPGAAAFDSSTACMTDADGDGYGDDSPATGVTAGTDCDDTDASFSPGATEGVGDEVDQDCDGGETCYADADDDGFIDGTTTVASADVDCTDPGEGQASDAMGECDDSDATTFPGAAAFDSSTACMTDGDGDGYGDDSPATGVTAGTDCDDTDATRSPDATEVCDGLDNDCDGAVDPSDAADASEWYADADGDGFGDPDSPSLACEQPEVHVADNTDCDDTDASAYPGAGEVAGDGIDQDCDGSDTPADDAPVEEEPEEPEEPDGDDKDSGGCSATSAPPSAIGALVVLGVVGLTRRRRTGTVRGGGVRAPRPRNR